MSNTNKILVGKHQGKDHFGDLGIDGRIILNEIREICVVSI
jgi:hypothetical protein